MTDENVTRVDDVAGGTPAALPPSSPVTSGSPGEAVTDIVSSGPGDDVPLPPHTGDPSVDEALARLHATATDASAAAPTDQEIDRQVQAGETTHGVLQGRLTDLGGD